MALVDEVAGADVECSVSVWRRTRPTGEQVVGDSRRPESAAVTVRTGSELTGPGDDTTAGVIGRLRGEFEGRINLAEIARVVLGCRADLTCSPPPALPELIERLARQRLLDTPPRAGSPHPDHPGFDRICFSRPAAERT